VPLTRLLVAVTLLSLVMTAGSGCSQNSHQQASPSGVSPSPAPAPKMPVLEDDRQQNDDQGGEPLGPGGEPMR
jgi:hypothetical protein